MIIERMADNLGLPEQFITKIARSASHAYKSYSIPKRTGGRRTIFTQDTPDAVAYVGRAYKRRIRALVHRIDSLDASTRTSLAGMIAYVTGFDPQFENSLIEKYGFTNSTEGEARIG